MIMIDWGKPEWNGWSKIPCLPDVKIARKKIAIIAIMQASDGSCLWKMICD